MVNPSTTLDQVNNFSVSSTTMEQAKRDSIVNLHRAGHSPGNITKLLGMTVSRVIARYEATRTSTLKAHSPRSDIKHTPRFLAGLKQSIKANPGKPMSALTKDRQVARSTISKAIKEDLGYKSFVLKVRHILTDSQREIRVTNGTRLLNSLKSTSRHLRLFLIIKLSLWTGQSTGETPGGSFKIPPRSR